MTDMTLTEFLTARLDEDERVASGLMGATRFVGSEPDFTGRGGPAAHEFWQRFDPAYVLAGIAAKRQIIAEHDTVNWQPGDRVHDCQWERPWPCPTLRLLAVVYDQHPHYDETWRPA